MTVNVEFTDKLAEALWKEVLCFVKYEHCAERISPYEIALAMIVVQAHVLAALDVGVDAVDEMVVEFRERLFQAMQCESSHLEAHKSH